MNMFHISYPQIKECKHKGKYVLCIKCNDCGRFRKKRIKKIERKVK